MPVCKSQAKEFFFFFFGTGSKIYCFSTLQITAIIGCAYNLNYQNLNAVDSPLEFNYIAACYRL